MTHASFKALPYDTEQPKFFQTQHEAEAWLKTQGGGTIQKLSPIPLAFPISNVIYQNKWTRV